MSSKELSLQERADALILELQALVVEIDLQIGAIDVAQEARKKEENRKPTLAEEIAAEQFQQHLEGKEVKEYPKVLEDM